MGNLKTSPAMSVYLLSLFQSKRGDFFCCRQVARSFCFFSETYHSKFEFWINPKKYWNWNQTHWWAFSPCISTTIKYTVSTSQSTCFIETFSSRDLFPYLGTDHYFSGKGYKKFFSGNIFINTYVCANIFFHHHLRTNNFFPFFLVFFYLCSILPLPY